jgi:Berberine and berberine like
MHRRTLFKCFAAIPALQFLSGFVQKSAIAVQASTGRPTGRVRPSDASWSSPDKWEKLKEDVGGQLIKAENPLKGCQEAPENGPCQEVLRTGDPRPGARASHVWWTGNGAEVGVFWHGYQSAWLPQSLLEEGAQQRLADALFAATRSWWVSLHFNKGLAGAPLEVIEAARDTATNPLVLDAFALAIIAGGTSHAYTGIARNRLDLAKARIDAGNYSKLQAVKTRYDPMALFFVHHGVGSEAWSADGFSRSA